MPTKTKIPSHKTRGRPKKTFKMRNTNGSDIKRGRGRPKKNNGIKYNDNINTKISKYSLEIKQISQEHKKIHLDIKNSSFFSKKIKEEKNTNTDKFALGLLIFSMLLFIFSLYKTFYLAPNMNHFTEVNNHQSVSTNILTETSDITGNNNMVTQDTTQDIKESINTPSNKSSNITKDKYGISDIDVINMLYKTINEKSYDELSYFGDNYMKHSSLFNVYYTKNWLGNFLSHLTNERVYITNMKEITGEYNKVGVNYYSYTIKYKLKNNNKLFTEQWKVAIVIRNDKKLIGSLQCTNNGCSKMPFFNPAKYGIK